MPHNLFVSQLRSDKYISGLRLMDSLYFKTKQDLSVDKTHLIEILFKDWVDTVCNREVEFSIERRISEEWLPGMVTKKETFRVDFQRAEDMTMIKLIGLPNEFLNLIEFAAN